MILFLAANPRGTDRFALDLEARRIRKELARSPYRYRFKFETNRAAHPSDLVRGLRKFRPTVVHFTGHGNEGGLYFQAPDGSAQLISTEELIDTFRAAGSSVRLAVLNASYSDAPAEALRAHVDCVIGVRGAIADSAAEYFAAGFYGGLAEGVSIASAFREGLASILLGNVRDKDRLVLKVRSGVDAERLVLATERPTAADVPAAEPGNASDA